MVPWWCHGAMVPWWCYGTISCSTDCLLAGQVTYSWVAWAPSCQGETFWRVWKRVPRLDWTKNHLAFHKFARNTLIVTNHSPLLRLPCFCTSPWCTPGAFSITLSIHMGKVESDPHPRPSLFCCGQLILKVQLQLLQQLRDTTSNEFPAGWATMVTGCKCLKVVFSSWKGKRAKTTEENTKAGKRCSSTMICYIWRFFGSLSLSHLITSVLHTHVTCLEVIGGLQTSILHVSMGFQIPSNQLSQLRSTNSIQPQNHVQALLLTSKFDFIQLRHLNANESPTKKNHIKLLMVEILRKLIDGLSHSLQGLIPPNWCSTVINSASLRSCSLGQESLKWTSHGGPGTSSFEIPFLRGNYLTN